jgi:hypothetical protein
LSHEFIKRIGDKHDGSFASDRIHKEHALILVDSKILAGSIAPEENELRKVLCVVLVLTKIRDLFNPPQQKSPRLRGQ